MRNTSTPKLLLYNFTNISEVIKTQSIGKKRRSDTYIVLYIIKKRTCIYILVLSELRRITLLNLENLYIYMYPTFDSHSPNPRKGKERRCK